MELSPIESLRIRSPMDAWTTKEHLYLTSAVSQNGEQNWAAVSRALRLLNTDSSRPQDWFSTKNCALQYAKLLEQVDTPKRKREKSEDQQSDTPGQSVHRMIKKKRVEELKQIIEEEKKQYLQLKKDITLLEMNQSEAVLHQYWEGIMQEQKKADEERDKKNEFYREREEKLKKILVARLSIKGGSLAALKKRMSPAKHIPVCSTAASTSVGLSSSQSTMETSLQDSPSVKEEENLKEREVAVLEEEVMTDQIEKAHTGNVEIESVTKALSFEIKEEEDVKSFDGFGISPARSEATSITKTEVDGTSVQSSMTLDYASSLSTPNEEKNIRPISETERSSEVTETVRMQHDHDYIQGDDSEATSTSVKVKVETPEVVSDNTILTSDTEIDSQSATLPTESLRGVLPFPIEGTASEEEKKTHKEPKDEYEFDDDASRDSAEVKEYMSRVERKKFSFGDGGIASPVVSEGTPSSPASTYYGDDPEAEKLHRSWKRSVMLIWSDIAAHKNASIFLKPISEDKVPGYHSIVYRPFDLMTIKRSIENGTTRSTQEFQHDIMVMFLNAKMYNKSTHNVYRMAEEMMKDAMETIEEFIQTQIVAKVSDAPQKHLRRETRESSSKRGGATSEDGKRKREETKEDKPKKRKM